MGKRARAEWEAAHAEGLLNGLLKQDWVSRHETFDQLEFGDKFLAQASLSDADLLGGRCNPRLSLTSQRPLATINTISYSIFGRPVSFRAPFLIIRHLFS